MKTVYKITMPNKTEFLIGDKILRIVSIITNTIELVLIIYLLLR